jgi:hypothetical protein
MSFSKEKTTTYEKIGDFVDGHCIIFSIFFYLVMFHGPQTWSFTSVEKYMLYIKCSLILSNSLHLIVESRLILTQNELCVSKYYQTNSTCFWLCLG